MFWLIPYIFFAVAILTLFAGFGYVIVVYFAVVQRVLALTLDRILARLTSTADERFKAYRVKHHSKGTLSLVVSSTGGSILRSAKLGHVLCVL